MRKLTALIVVLLGLTLLPSCQVQETEDVDPITTEIVQVDDQASEGDEDPTGSGGSGTGGG